jgi:hypothetical protein
MYLWPSTTASQTTAAVCMAGLPYFVLGTRPRYLSTLRGLSMAERVLQCFGCCKYCMSWVGILVLVTACKCNRFHKALLCSIAQQYNKHIQETDTR